MMLHHYNCLLFIIIPPVTDVHYAHDTEENRMWKESLAGKIAAKERLSIIYTFDKVMK